ncbi:MAG: NAD(P)/FAD-dependent oxidoreductase [Firmicutes bacterium]|nr:NAD(P)/FAD-dependent oxidoreductase [Bacillota bacterium]
MGKKLAVIGAGPGGLFAAKEAAALGFSVTVFEKRKVGEQIFCAEGFVDVLKLLPPPVTGMLFPVDEVLITVKDQFTVNTSRLNLWMLDRQLWQQGLAEEAIAGGCEIIEEYPITPQQLQKMQAEFDWIIDASGVKAVSAKAFQLPEIRQATTAQYTLEGDFSALAGKLKVVLDSRCSGYAWIFPKSNSVANVGLGWFGSKLKGLRIKEELDLFLQRENLAHYKIIKHAGGPIPIVCREDIVKENVLLIGDAAGFGSPLHGGGVDTACISGILAARAAAAGAPDRYEKEAHRLIIKRLKLEQKILDLWEKTDFDTLNRYAASAFVEDSTQSSWKKFMVPEAIVLRSILGGRLRADWEQGIILDDLPLMARMIFKAALAGK